MLTPNPPPKSNALSYVTIDTCEQNLTENHDTHTDSPTDQDTAPGDKRPFSTMDSAGSLRTPHSEEIIILFSFVTFDMSRMSRMSPVLLGLL